MAERFNEVVGIRQVNSDVGGVSSALSLANRLGEFKDQQIQIRKENATERGIEKAGQVKLEKTDVNGKQVTQAPEMQDIGFFGSIEGKAYNKTLRAAYVASLDSDNRTAINRIRVEHPNDIDAFNAAANGYMAGVIKGVDPIVKQAVTIDLQDRIATAGTNVQIAGINKAAAEANSAILTNANAAEIEASRFARGGDHVSAGEELLRFNTSIDESNLSQEQKAKRKRAGYVETEENFVKHDFDVLIEKEGLDAGFAKLSEMEGKVPKGWKPDEWESLVKSQRTELNALVTAEEKRIRKLKEAAVIDNSYASIQARYDGDDTQIINPKDLDKFYQERVEPILASMPEETRQSSQAVFIDRMKIIPTTVKKQITNAVNSDNPALMVQAAKLVDRIDGIRGVVEQIPIQEQAFLVNIVGLLETMNPSEAIDLARRATDPKDKARIEVAKQTLSDIKDKPSFYKDKAQVAFDGGYFGFQADLDAVAGAQLTKEYRVVYDNSVLSGMSEVDATTKADNVIHRVWGADSTFGDRRVMKYPLANYYSVNGDTEWVKKQALKEANAEVAGGGIEAKDIYLMANDTTARTATILEPSYAMKVMIDGAFHNLGQWKPDMNKEKTRVRTLNIEDGLEQRKRAISNRIKAEQLIIRGGP